MTMNLPNVSESANSLATLHSDQNLLTSIHYYYVSIVTDAVPLVQSLIHAVIILLLTYLHFTTCTTCTLARPHSTISRTGPLIIQPSSCHGHLILYHLEMHSSLKPYFIKVTFSTLFLYLLLLYLIFAFYYIIIG